MANLNISVVCYSLVYQFRKRDEVYLLLLHSIVNPSIPHTKQVLDYNKEYVMITFLGNVRERTWLAVTVDQINLLKCGRRVDSVVLVLRLKALPALRLSMLFGR
jgi:hypothetical protein